MLTEKVCIATTLRIGFAVWWFCFAKVLQKSKPVKRYSIKFIMEMEVLAMIAEMRINGKPSPYICVKYTEKGLVYTGKLITATVMSVTNYFRLPNDIFNLDLCAEEIAVYAFILRMENRRTYTCFPSYKTIGRALKMSKNTVAKYVHSLEEKKLIELEPTSVYTKNGLKLNGNLQYKVLPIKNNAFSSFWRYRVFDLRGIAFFLKFFSLNTVLIPIKKKV